MKRLTIGVATAIIIGITVYFPLKSYILKKYGVSEVTVAASVIKQYLGFESEAKIQQSIHSRREAQEKLPEAIAIDSGYIPFRDIGSSLGERALRNNSMLWSQGGAIFDANNDGREDIYLTHSGRPVSKKVDQRNVLTGETAPAKPNVLYLNQGNNDSGEPVYRSIQDLTKNGNSLFLEQELLIENKYKPRRTPDEDEFSVGRISTGAIAADFNGDGLLDLYVLASHYGIMAQSHELGFPSYPAKNHLGREARSAREALVVRTPAFLWGEMQDGKDVMVNFGKQLEAEGRNSLFINLGDKDGDGLPEWKDVTHEAGVGGNWTSTSAAVADVDRDGDLDLYVANFLDPDYWGFGAKYFAGNRNQLYINRLVDTGKLTFQDKSATFNVSGLHLEEGLEASVWRDKDQSFFKTSKHIVDGKQVGEQADHSWSAMFMDFNQDHWPDLVVSNDMSNRLRIYENIQGKSFHYLEAFNDAEWDGCWMGLSAGDLNGDLKEELLIANCGSQTMSAKNTGLLVETEEELNLTALAYINYMKGKSTLHHAVLEYHGGNSGFHDLSGKVKVNHSSHIPPDMSNPMNFTLRDKGFFERNNFSTSLRAYEFAWNLSLLDIDNDQDLDLYMAGALARGNDNFIGDTLGSPGRLLVNESSEGGYEFTDRTLEYQLLDIRHMDYTHNPPRRVAPGTGWTKRDYIYISDTDAYSSSGVDAAESTIRDIFRMHEAASATLNADVNGDGFIDILVTHAGGYNSVSPQARNLKVEFGGRILAVPAPNKVVSPPTQFEEGHTSLYINGGSPKNSQGNWVKIHLRDQSSNNLFAIGAKLIVNKDKLYYTRVGGSAFGAVTTDLHIGLGDEALHSVDITWPSGSTNTKKIVLDDPAINQKICIDRKIGVYSCNL
ncbi:CRTAC1 family protein [Microbulbifer sp. 2205BS26-8]|uniref:CRTAC1 family protein n=1 Tax=Microbulbifer sp. 2205BS26-8 TaxID=3064386 RepID=UPI00273D9CC8|nr:CRTAC1 family protein [Microbulbifer sp. 2205BS26-8]MDP5210665.1 CRTAC1 family protein [Microbulbifer sp. 2205BS26-8]